jgi:hypothetical protein
MGVLWELGQQEILQYLILLPWVIALFLRIYLPEKTWAWCWAWLIPLAAYYQSHSR